ncbi:hypothetical protein [Streptomyces oceani]|uniref:Uncharacterized protein n=1 Tax=Streptomyces oceani TaxID=1075402 RepID=A0A1E7KMG4_9ACTN|nr:hypothetical protein [Streptomyces oceani]OEV05169.1 hypothetical protein AN216_04105 [Streptomyces oceani]
MTGRDTGRGTEAAKPAAPTESEGGESACWLDRVCPECGRLAEAAPPTVCARCGASMGDTFR